MYDVYIYTRIMGLSFMEGTLNLEEQVHCQLIRAWYTQPRRASTLPTYKGLVHSAYKGLVYCQLIRAWYTQPIRAWYTQPIKAWYTQPVRAWYTQPIRAWYTQAIKA